MIRSHLKHQHILLTVADNLESSGKDWCYLTAGISGIFICSLSTRTDPIAIQPIHSTIRIQEMTVPERSLHISELEHWMDEPFLSKAFQEVGYGSFLTRIKVGRDKLTDQPCSYAFLEFASRAKAEEVMESLNGKPLPHSDKSFKLRWAISSSKEDVGKGLSDPQVYVSGFDQATTQAALMEFFKAKYPSVVSARIHVDPVTKLPKSYGFVNFYSAEEAQRAVLEQNGKHLGGKKIKVSFADKTAERLKAESQPAQSASLQPPEDNRALSASQKQQLYEYYMTLINDPAMRLEYERQLQQLYGIDPKQLKKRTLKNDLDLIPVLDYPKTLESEKYLYQTPKMQMMRDKQAMEEEFLK